MLHASCSMTRKAGDKHGKYKQRRAGGRDFQEK